MLLYDACQLVIVGVIRATMGLCLYKPSPTTTALMSTSDLSGTCAGDTCWPVQVTVVSRLKLQTHLMIKKILANCQLISVGTNALFPRNVLQSSLYLKTWAVCQSDSSQGKETVVNYVIIPCLSAHHLGGV